MRVAIATLNLVVFVSVEVPDRVAASEASRFRRQVDAALGEGLVADGWGLDAAVREVQGSVHERVKKVLVRLTVLEPATRCRSVP